MLERSMRGKRIVLTYINCAREFPSECMLLGMSWTDDGIFREEWTQTYFPSPPPPSTTLAVRKSGGGGGGGGGGGDAGAIAGGVIAALVVVGAIVTVVVMKLKKIACFADKGNVENVPAVQMGGAIDAPNMIVVEKQETTPMNTAPTTMVAPTPLPHVPTSSAVAGTPGTLEELLDAARVDKSKYLQPLIDLGVSLASECKDLTDEDLDSIGMSKLLKKRLFAEVAKLP